MGRVQAQATAAASPREDNERFGFGANWQDFLSSMDEERIHEAERSLIEHLGPDGVAGRTFLDMGCGSGLFSLAAVRLGATRVHSFDFDADSVAGTTSLRERFGPAGADWTIERGDVLDTAYLERLGTFDVVYSWGVLHHTGAMWQALANATRPIRPGGTLFISIYNDQGLRSRLWHRIKRRYNRTPPALRTPYVLANMIPFEAPRFVWTTLRRGPTAYLREWRAYKRRRGMSRWHDMVDWVGGYPFEVARPDEVFTFFARRGFTLVGMKTVRGGIGCNEFVFRAPAA